MDLLADFQFQLRYVDTDTRALGLKCNRDIMTRFTGINNEPGLGQDTGYVLGFVTDNRRSSEMDLQSNVIAHI